MQRLSKFWSKIPNNPILFSCGWQILWCGTIHKQRRQFFWIFDTRQFFNTIHRQFWLISDTVVYGRSLWVLWDWIRCLHFIWSRSIYQVFKQSISTVRCKSLWFIGMFQDEKAVKIQKSGRNYNHGIGEATTWNHLRFEFLLPHSN